MATPSSVLAWKIPRTEEPGGLWPRGSQRLQRTQVRRLSTHAGFTQSWRRLRRMHTSCAYPWKTLRTGTQAVVLGRQDFSSFPLLSVFVGVFYMELVSEPESWGSQVVGPWLYSLLTSEPWASYVHPSKPKFPHLQTGGDDSSPTELL